MDEKRQEQIVDSLKKVDPKLIADVIREILRSDDDVAPIRKPPVNPGQNQPK
ncbi:MAG: hypothetical protein GX075_14110 [Firmicutes bacterium]|nr:hypothetical protein [Bacillota bacterium]